VEILFSLLGLHTINLFFLQLINIRIAQFRLAILFVQFLVFQRLLIFFFFLLGHFFNNIITSLFWCVFTLIVFFKRIWLVFFGWFDNFLGLFLYRVNSFFNSRYKFFDRVYQISFKLEFVMVHFGRHVEKSRDCWVGSVKEVNTMWWRYERVHLTMNHHHRTICLSNRIDISEFLLNQEA